MDFGNHRALRFGTLGYLRNLGPAKQPYKYCKAKCLVELLVS